MTIDARGGRAAALIPAGLPRSRKSALFVVGLVAIAGAAVVGHPASAAPPARDGAAAARALASRSTASIVAARPTGRRTAWPIRVGYQALDATYDPVTHPSGPDR